MKTIVIIFRSHWKRNTILLIVVAGIGFFLWNRNRTSTATPTYQTATVEKGTLIAAITASGTVSTANNVTVSTLTSGVVKKIFVKNGDTVKVGQKIADLELDQEGKQRYSSALSSYQSAQNNLTGAKASLYSLQSAMFKANQTFINGVVAENVDHGTPAYIQANADWLAAEGNYKKQEATISQAQNALNASWISYQQSSPAIFAPLTGTLTGFSLQEGSVITAQTTSTGSSSSQKIASVTTDAVPTISVNITQIDVPKIKVGQKVTVVLDAYPDDTFTGKVVSIDTVGSVSSGVTNYPTVIALDEKNEKILPNMSATANIITESKTDVLMVPSTAVKTQNGVSTVQVMKDGKPVNVTVTIGIASNTETVIISGLSEGDIVITATITKSATSTSAATSPFSAFGGGRTGGGIRTR